MPNERSRHPAPYSHVRAREMNDSDHSVSPIAETKIWNIVAHDARLFAIGARGQHDDGHVLIGGGMFVAVDIDKADRISVAS